MIYFPPVAALAVAIVTTNSWFEPVEPSDLAQNGVWRGVAWNDLDGDQDPDLAISGGHGVSLFRNDGGTLHKAATVDLPAQLSGEGIALVDVDGDARPDLFVANRSGPPRLYRNQGAFGFQLLEDDLSSITDFSHMGCFADFDGDGWLDLVVVMRDRADDVLLRNNRGRYVRTKALQGSGGDGRTCAVGDWNGDGRPDLYVGNFLDDSFKPTRRAIDRLYVNQGSLTFDTLIHGHAVNLPSMTYGATSVDWNEDGRVDLAVTHDGRADRNVLYENRAEDAGTVDLYPRGDELRLTTVQRGPSKGQVVADFDNDGDFDVFYAEGTEGLTVADAPFDVRDELYERKGDYFHHRIEPGLDADFRLGAGAASADLDGDGDLDMLVANWGGDQGQRVQLYRNLNGGRSLRVRLRGARENAQAIGAQLTLSVMSAGTAQMRKAFLWPQTGYASMNEPVVHFGLGREDIPTVVDVVWPDGARTSHAIEGNGTISVSHPAARR